MKLKPISWQPVRSTQSPLPESKSSLQDGFSGAPGKVSQIRGINPFPIFSGFFGGATLTW